GHRYIDISTFIEIINLLQIDSKEIQSNLVKYSEEIISLDTGIITKDGMNKQDQLIDALAVGVLGAKNQSPVVLVGKNLSASQKSL
ncbi:hypothetical protein ACTPEF_25705, partial [Clostridioides difficile]